MFKNYFRIALRSIWKYKTYTLINIIGLGIGIAAIVWGCQDYRFCFSYDNFHKDIDHVYRALTYKKDAEGMKGLFPMAAVMQAQHDFSGIREAVRLDSRGANVKYDKSDAFAEQIHFTDRNFFSLFNFPLAAGSNNIDDRSAILITEFTAKKYFGNQDPIGKVITIYAGEPYAMPLTVKGVLKDVPQNSTIHFGFITNFDNQLKPDGSKIQPDDWNWFLDAAYFSIPDPGDAARLEKEMAEYIPLQNKAREDWKVSAFKMITLRENAQQSEMISSDNLYQRPDDAAAYGPMVLAFLIFLSACLNFSNTTVARANRRLKEIGMRKVMGGTHAQLIRQFLLECAVIFTAGILLSMLLNTWWLPAFNSMFEGVKVQADYLHDKNLQVFIICSLIAGTFLAGAYPAFYVSKFNPSSIFRGSVKFGGSNLFSRLMLGLQLSIAVITIIAGLAFSRNAEYQRNYNFGYTRENTMGLSFSDSTSYTALKNAMSAIPEVTALTGTRNHIGFDFRYVVAEAEGRKKESDYLEVGSDYIKTMQLQIVAGRGFDANLQSDYTHALLITQNMAAMYGWSETQALGRQIHIDSSTYSVVGVLKDFHTDNLFTPIEPVAMKLVKDSRFQYLIIQAKPGDLNNVYAKAADVWKRLFPLKPFSGFYQNQITAEAYKTSSSIALIFSWFAVVCILLTATGLFALVSLTALKKMKEIAVRKVVGAAPHHILVLINKGYFWIFIISAILGCYGGWSLTKLLLDLIFKVNAGVELSSLLNSVFILFAVASFTSGIIIWRSVKINPANMLRAE